jgi:hypothetical protein
MLVRTLFLLVISLFSFHAAANEAMEKFLYIEALKGAFASDDTKDTYDKVERELKAIAVDKSNELLVQRYAVENLVFVWKSSGFGVVDEVWLIKNASQLYSSQDLFIENISAVFLLTAYIDSAPAFVAHNAIEIRKRSKFAGDLSGKILDLQTEALILSTEIYRRMGLNNLGDITKITKEERLALKDKIRSLLNRFRHSGFLQDLRGQNFVKILSREIASSDKSQTFNTSELQGWSEELFENIKIIYLDLESQELYIDRLGKAFLEDWLDEQFAKVKTGEVDADVFAAMLTRYFMKESTLPSAQVWLEAIKAIEPQTEIISENLVQEASAVLEVRRNWLKERLASFEFDQITSKSGKTLSGILVDNEEHIYTNFTYTNSLAKQVLELEKRLHKLIEVSKKVELTSPTEAERDEITSNYYHVMSQWLHIACLGLISQDQVAIEEERFSKYKPVFFNETVDLEMACKKPSKQEFHPSTVPLDRSLYFVLDKQLAAMWSPVIIESLIMIASIPLTVGSAGLAQAGTAAAGRYAGSLIAKSATQSIIRKIAQNRFLSVAGAKLGHAALGSLIFTSSFRVGLYAVTLGSYPLYEPQLSLWENYGHNLLFGTGVFLILPYTTQAGQLAFSKWIAPKLSPSLHRGAQTAVLTANDTAVFMVLPLVEARLTELMGGKARELEWSENFLHSVSIALAFRLYHPLPR